MKNINLKRALGFSVLLYLSTFIIFGILSLVFGVAKDFEIAKISIVQYVVYWLLFIPTALMLAKWYFKKFEPSFWRGVMLGVCTVIVSFVLDLISISISIATGESLRSFAAMYTDWTFYATIVIVIATTAYAGFEFDRTYTFDESGLKKILKNKK